MDKALELWKRVFRECGSPYTFPLQDRVCFFCGGIDFRHKLGCIWIEAKKLVEENVKFADANVLEVIVNGEIREKKL